MHLGVFPILRNGSTARGRNAGHLDAYHAGRSHFGLWKFQIEILCTIRDGCFIRALLGAARERALVIMALYYPAEKGVVQHVHLVNARPVVRLRAATLRSFSQDGTGWG